MFNDAAKREFSHFQKYISYFEFDFLFETYPFVVLYSTPLFTDTCLNTSLFYFVIFPRPSFRIFLLFKGDQGIRKERSLSIEHAFSVQNNN